MNSVIAVLSLAGLVASQAIEVMPVFTTSYAAGATPAAAQYGVQAAYGAAAGASGGGGYAQPEATAAPSATYDVYSAMPYQSMTAGGYKQLSCGYGWYKDSSSGMCMQESWVSFGSEFGRSASF